MKIAWLVLGSMLCLPALYADEQTRRVQEELRKRNLYFGDIDGQMTPQTAGALRAYQERKGFAASGTADPLTTESLGIDVKPALPDKPVLRSDIGLRKDEPKPSPAPQSFSFTSTAGAAELDPAAMPIGEFVDKAPPGARPLPKRQQEPARQLVANYLRDVSSNDPQRAMKYYADDVDYLHHGKVGKKTIHRAEQRYAKLWPSRQVQIVDAGYYSIKQRPGEIIVKFQADIAVANPRHHQHASDRTINVLTLRITGNNLKIVSVKEARVTGHRTRRPPFLCRLLHCS